MTGATTSQDSSARHLVVMGVSGSGKSSVAAELVDLLGWPFLEGDSLHPPSNVAKMAAGTPLTDADRAPWLAALADWTAERHGEGTSTVLACSALTRAYRDVLTAPVTGTAFVHLVGSRELLLERMSSRTGHFMPPALLDSQLATLEPLADDEVGIVVDVRETPAAIAGRVVEWLT